MDAYPDSILQADYCGELPLYMLFDPKVHSNILEHVLRTRPSLALFVEKRFSGSHTLLQRMCTQWMNTVRKINATTTNSRTNDAAVIPHEMVCSNSTLSNQWTKLVLLVKAAHRVSALHAENRIPELHVALQMRSLPQAIRCQFVELYPEQASIPMDCRSETRCLEACTVSKVLSLHYFLSDCQQHAIATRTQKRRRVTVTMEEKDHSCLLKGLVRAFPQAASMEMQFSKRTQSSGFPLQLAISSGIFDWDHGLRELVYANPSALSWKDRTTHLLPFLQETAQLDDRASCSTEMAARPADITTNGKNKSLGTVYCLLREDPSVLATMTV